LRFEWALETHGDRTALIEDDRPISYAQLAEWCDRQTAALGSGKKLVAIVAHPTVETVAAYLGALRGGHAVMMLDASLPEEKRKRLMALYGVDFLCDARRHGGWARLDEGGGNVHEALALLLGTSGSTGDSKMVRLSFENLHANCASILAYLPVGADDRVTTHLPLHYSYGLSVLHTHLARGATIVLTGASIVSRDFWDLAGRYEITTFNGVPSHYEMLRRIGFLKKPPVSLRVMTQAGGRLAEATVRQFSAFARERGVDFFVMYGQTEATARIAYVPPEALPEKAGAIGIPIPGVTLDVAEGASAESPQELICRGENVMMGYASKREDLAKGDDLQGVLATGDLGYRDADGFFMWRVGKSGLSNCTDTG
jgi:acyl-CoA synthetase (AMP-forming)/AMP-acid ligase II